MFTLPHTVVDVHPTVMASPAWGARTLVGAHGVRAAHCVDTWGQETLVSICWQKKRDKQNYVKPKIDVESQRMSVYLSVIFCV